MPANTGWSGACGAVSGGDGLMKRLAVIHARGGRLLVSSQWTSGGLFLQGDRVEVVDEPVSDEELGRMVRSALAAGRDEVPYPDPDLKRQVEMLLKIAGVRSAAQFVRGTHEVNVESEDAEPVMTVTPTRSDGRGFAGIPGQEITVNAAASDAGLGAAVRRALAIAAGPRDRRSPP
jgi:hypothetical protein